jgi:drug/metabolite transporter (DMT)-like permease
MPDWVLATLAAAFCQNLRSAFQKQLKRRLSTWGATATRFVYAAPLAVGLLLMLVWGRGTPLPDVPPHFFVYAGIGAVAQMIATGLLVHLFSRANFATATAFTKTEPIQAALIGALLLGDTLTLPVMLAIITGIFGVILMSLPKTPGHPGWRLDGAVWTGLLSGACFAVSSVALRGASLSLEGADLLLGTATTLAFVTLLQSALLLGWLAWREPGQIRKLFAAWRQAGWVGVIGFAGSMAWIAAFTLQDAASVKAVGQIEIVFTLIASRLVFRERLRAAELVGISLLASGVVGIVLLNR